MAREGLILHTLTTQEHTMDKEQQRKELEKQLLAFFNNGGKIQKLQGKKNPVQRKVTA